MTFKAKQSQCVSVLNQSLETFSAIVTSSIFSGNEIYAEQYRPHS